MSLRTAACECGTQVATRKVRAAAKDEITVLRDKVEDKLRLDVLAVTWDEQQIATLGAILNAPWDKRGIEYLWHLATRYDKDASTTTDFWQKGAILNLLAFVATKNGDTDAGKLAMGKFDALFRQIAATDSGDAVL